MKDSSKQRNQLPATPLPRLLCAILARVFHLRHSQSRDHQLTPAQFSTYCLHRLCQSPSLCCNVRHPSAAPSRCTALESHPFASQSEQARAGTAL